MEREYFNYSTKVTSQPPGYWARREFIQQWRKIYANDKRWTPPSHSWLMRSLETDSGSYLAQQRPTLLYLTALARRRQTGRTADSALPLAGSMAIDGSMMEQAVCAAVLLSDPHNRERTGALALLQCVNDTEVLERFVWTLMEQSYALGVRRFVGPTGLSPLLHSGVLKSHFADSPPFHTPYNPPYAAELFDSVLDEVAEARLFTVDLAGAAPLSPDDDIRCMRIPHQALDAPLKAFMASAIDASPFFRPPDGAEIDFVLEGLGEWPLELWVAYQEDAPVGYVLLQPDLGAAVRRAGGGRHPAWRAWLHWRKERPADAGRIVLGGVLPAWRRQGIGRRLWQQALERGRAQGWQRLTIGPVDVNSSAAVFLQEMNATARQHYGLYAADV